MSMGRAAGSFDDGTRATTPASVTSTTGTLTRNTEPHQKWLSSTPPTTGPAAPARPATPDHRAIARPRSTGGKTFERMARVAGMLQAPPTPMSARAAIRCWDVPAHAAAADETPNTTRPMMSRPLRPNRSPSPATGSSRPASTRLYAVVIHWRVLSLASRSRAMLGSATVRMVLSMTMIVSARHSTTRIDHRCG